MTWFLHIPINVFFLEKSATMDGDLGGWARKKSCDVNESPGYIYCISGWNKASILCCCVYCTKLYVYPWQKFKMVFLWSVFFFWQISNNDCINMYMVNFFIWLYAWLTFFSGCIYGLNYIWFTESQIRILSTTGMGRRLYGDATASLSCYRITCLSPIPTSLSLLYPKKR